MLYVSLRAMRNFPTSCQFYIVLCFKYLEIFTNKKLLISSENVMRMISEKHLIRNDPNKFSWKMQNQESFIIIFLPFPLYANSLPVMTSSKLKDKR